MAETVNNHPGNGKDDEQEAQGETPQQMCARYLAEIEHAEDEEDFRNFLTEGEEAYKYYKNQSSSFNQGNSERVRFNVFWANVEVLLPIYYARLPTLVGKRRYESDDDVALLACKILENATNYSLDQEADNFNQVIEMCLKDMIIVGRGVGRVFYQAEFAEDGTVIPFSEKAVTGYVFWKDYLTNRARNASEHRWRAHKSRMTRHELKQRFGELGAYIPLTETTARESDSGSDKKDYVNRAEVWEMWDQVSKTRCLFSPGYMETPLEVKSDPLKLDNFYPYPRPLTGTTGTNSDVPTGQYKIDRGLLEELRQVVNRIAEIRRIIKVVGFHDRIMHEDIVKVKNANDGETIPANFPQGKDGGLRSGIEWFPFEKAANALDKLLQYSEWLINKLFQQDGIPDIVRGASNPNETLGAQQLKSNFTIIRTSKKQADVQRFVRDLLSMKAQIIFEPGFFSDESIWMMAGVDGFTEDEKILFPQALALLRDDKMRTFRIEIETDSTIAVDEEAEKQSAIEAFTGINQGINTAFQVMQLDPKLGIAMMEHALYVARRFRGSRDLQGAFQRWIDAKEAEMDEQEAFEEAVKRGEAEPPPPPVDPAQIKAEADMAIQQSKLALEEQKAMHKAQLDEAIAQHKAATDQMRVMSEIEMKQAKLQADSLLKEKEIALKAQTARMEMMQQAIQNAERQRFDTVEALKAQASKEPSIPNITIQIPGSKKVARTTRDPVTGDYISTSEDLQ